MLAVVGYHASLGLSGGFVGVDVFFVISGYLITELILKESENGTFRIQRFWERRVRRILPALFVVVVFSGIGSWFLLLPDDFKRTAGTALAQAGFVSNIYCWLSTGYFAGPAEAMPLLHTWSLSVEEQFYLFFPFLMMLLRGFSRNRLTLILVVLFLVSFGSCVFFSNYKPLANFYLLPMRAWELLTGAIATTFVTRHPFHQWLKELLGGAGLAAILYSVFFFDTTTRFPGLAATLPCLGAAAIISTGKSQLTMVGRFLALPPLVFVGLISYSLYLWHWPLLVFSKYWAISPLETPQLLLIVLASLIMAYLSWKFVELPFRRRVVLGSPTGIFVFAGCATVIIAVAGIVVREANGFPNRFSAQAIQLANASQDMGQPIELGLKDVVAGKFIGLGPGDQQLPVSFFLWGDSHAMVIISILDKLCDQHRVRGLAATRAGNLPLLNFESHGTWRGVNYVEEDSVAYNAAILAYIRQSHIPNVILAAQWGPYDYTMDDAGAADLRTSLLTSLDELKKAGCHVWIMEQVPVPGINVPRALSSALIFRGQDPSTVIFPLTTYYKYRQIQDKVFRDLSSYDNVTLLDPMPLFLNGQNQLIAISGGKSLYFDGNHLTPAGTDRLRPMFEPIFEGMANHSQ